MVLGQERDDGGLDWRVARQMERCTSETHVGCKPAKLGGIWDVEGERKEKSGRTPTLLALQIGGHGCHLLRWGKM